MTSIISEFVEDKDKANEIAYKIAELAEANSLAQIAVNEKQAAHKNLFVAGSRPAILWICAAALANNYIILPYAAALGLPIVALDVATLNPLMMGMLGIAGARSFEKAKGVARSS